MSQLFLILGFGYTSNALAQNLTSFGFKVVGTKRRLSEESTNTPMISLIDFNSPDLEKYLSQASHLLVSIPPKEGIGDLVLTTYGDLIKKHSSNFQWIGYLSSTGVYGDHQGKWVNEETVCKPHTRTALLRLKAEEAWLSYAKKNKLPLHIFRLAGIYGKGRNAVERIYHGKPYSIFKERQVFCRIHVEDIISVLMASMKSINPFSIYNVADDEPEASHSVDSYAALLLNKAPPTLIPYDEICLSPMEQEFYSNNRRVANNKVKQELKINLKFPNFREGLTHIWREDFEHLL